MWRPVTKEWLRLGFARGLAASRDSGNQPVAVHPNAILYVSDAGRPRWRWRLTATRPRTRASRSAEPTPSTTGSPSTSTMLAKAKPETGLAAPGRSRQLHRQRRHECGRAGCRQPAEVAQRHDRHHRQPGRLRFAKRIHPVFFGSPRNVARSLSPVPSVIKGEYGFEDVINSASNNGTPDGAPEAPVTISARQPVSRRRGQQRPTRQIRRQPTSATALALIPIPVPPDPFTTRIANCFTTGRKNRVTGARHVLKLVDGSLRERTRPASAQRGWHPGRVHRGFRESGLHSGRLQQQLSGGPDLGQHDGCRTCPFRRGRDC